MIGVILGIIWFYVILRWDVYDDLKRIGDGTIKHTKEVWQRVLYLIPSFLCLLLPIYSLTLLQIILKFSITLGLMLFYWLLFFYGWLNILRKESWWYLGSIDADDPWSDKLQRKIPLNQLKILKIGLPVIFTILYIVVKLFNNLKY